MMINKVLKKIVPSRLIEVYKVFNDFLEWKERGFLKNSPQFIKETIFVKYGVPSAPWVETGTYVGTTTKFLLDHFGKVYSVEPSYELYMRAVKKFESRDVELFNDVSEVVFPELLKEINGDCNFWLDGHYSAGLTFRGEKDCPVEDELSAIEDNICNFSDISILIDDVRCFVGDDSKYIGYPSINRLVDWARKNKFSWRVEHDIFIMRRIGSMRISVESHDSVPIC